MPLPGLLRPLEVLVGQEGSQRAASNGLLLFFSSDGYGSGLLCFTGSEGGGRQRSTVFLGSEGGSSGLVFLG